MIFGSSTLSELVQIETFMKRVSRFEISFVGFHSENNKKRLCKYCEGTKFILKFVPLTKLRQFNNYFDAILSFSCLFRQASPNVYNKANKHLRKEGIDTNFPLLSDRNNIFDFTLTVIEAQKLFLRCLKPNGVVITYPLFVSWEIFSSLYSNNDFVRLNTDINITYGNCRNNTPPSYITSPISLHLESEPALYDDRYIASELIRNDKTAMGVSYHLSETCPKTCNSLTLTLTQKIQPFGTIAKINILK